MYAGRRPGLLSATTKVPENVTVLVLCHRPLGGALRHGKCQPVARDGRAAGEPKRLAKLSDRQRGWLRQAASDAAARSTRLFANEGPLTGRLCKEGARFGTASSTDLAAMRLAFAPAYDALERDRRPGTSSPGSKS